MKTQSPWKSYGRYGTVGIELFLSIVVGFLAGRWVDGKVGGHGWFTIGGVVFGLIAGFRAMYKVAKHMLREAERDEAMGERLPNLWGENDWADSRQGPMKRVDEAQPQASNDRPQTTHSSDEPADDTADEPGPRAPPATGDKR